MHAERRNRYLDLYYHITLSLYALASIAISLFYSAPSTESFGKIATFTPICTLSLSLLIFGFKFAETAAQHRSCYLALQLLRCSNTESNADLNERYINTLGHYPNHSTNDYLSACLTSLFNPVQGVKDSNGIPVTLSILQRFFYVIRWIFLRVLAILFAIITILLLVIAIDVLTIFND